MWNCLGSDTGKDYKTDSESEEEEYEVEKILAARFVKQKRQYLVKWVNHAEEWYNWEEIENLERSHEVGGMKWDPMKWHELVEDFNKREREDEERKEKQKAEAIAKKNHESDAQENIVADKERSIDELESSLRQGIKRPYILY